MPNLRFAVRAEEAGFLAADAAGGRRKNISLDPADGRLQNATLGDEGQSQLAAMLDRFGRSAMELIGGLAPDYARTLSRGRASFRPVEIEDRPTSPRHDDRRLHVDAFPSRPTRGERILRVFCNVAPDGRIRQWVVGEPFEAFAAKQLPRVSRGLPASAWLLERLGVTKGRRSAYDTLMLGLHDRGKLDEAYQANAPRTPLNFPPGTTWAVFTDQVLHAALGGRCALEQTFLVPITAMTRPEQAPLRVLERMTGRRLA
jgi:hypothetical protein